MGSDNSGNSIKSGSKALDFTSKLVQFKPRSELSYKIEKSSGRGTSSSSLELRNNSQVRVEDRYRVELDSLATGVNKKASQVKLSTESFKLERQLLNELKFAFQSGNEVAALKIRDELKGVREQREVNTNKQKSESISSSGENSLRFGSVDIRKPNAAKIELSETKRKVPVNPEEADKQLEELEEDLQLLEFENQELEQARSELAKSLNAQRAARELELEDPLANIDSARISARIISVEAMALDREELLSAVADTIDLETVISALKS